MIPYSRLCCCIFLVAIRTASATMQEPAYESRTVTRTAAIEAIDKENRVLTLKDPDGASTVLKAPDELVGFETLRVGHVVIAVYFRAMAIRAHRPEESAPSIEPPATVRRDESVPGSESRLEQTFVVTVEAIDLKAPSLRVMESDGRELTLTVRDSKPLEKLKTGDTIDVTYYDSLVVNVHAPERR